MMAAPRLVLVQPRNVDNLVAIGRAMKTFGLVDWVTVASESSHRGMREVLRRHREPAAEHALVATLRRVDTLAEAIADCSWVVGTTMRTIDGRPRFTARELAAESVRRHDSTWALVFGAESNGLRNAEVDQCHAVSFIPSSDAQPSLNLSQAVVVYAHELATVRTGGATPGQPALADDATLRAVEQELINALVAGGSRRDARADRRIVAALMSSLMRGSLSVAEAAAWRRLLARRP